LLSHLNLVDAENELTSIDWTDWNSLREYWNRANLFYINDFCSHFAYQHANNRIISRDFVKRAQYMLIKTTMGGKTNRGLLHLISLLQLRKHQQSAMTAVDVHNALTVAVCIEGLQSYFLVMDDVMDGSVTRRGQPCWYRFPNVGLKAVNDGPMIESCFLWLIEHRLMPDGNAVLVDRIKELFREINLLTIAGQSTDLELVKDAESLRDIYSVDRYDTIAMYKTSFYTFYLPYAAALYLAGYDDKKEGGGRLRKEMGIGAEDDVIDDGFLFHICRQLSIDIGIKFQVDDDYLDCYGDPEVTGKVGTDIEDFKCSWIVAKALELMDDAQYEVLKRHYGKSGKEDVKAVKELFGELGMEQVYQQWEAAEHDRLITLVDQCEGILPREMFTLMLDRLHKRQK